MNRKEYLEKKLESLKAKAHRQATALGLTNEVIRLTKRQLLEEFGDKCPDCNGTGCDMPECGNCSRCDGKGKI